MFRLLVLIIQKSI